MIPARAQSPASTDGQTNDCRRTHADKYGDKCSTKFRPSMISGVPLGRTGRAMSSERPGSSSGGKPRCPEHPAESLFGLRAHPAAGRHGLRGVHDHVHEAAQEVSRRGRRRATSQRSGWARSTRGRQRRCRARGRERSGAIRTSRRAYRARGALAQDGRRSHLGASPAARS